MAPLTMTKPGETASIKKAGADEEIGKVFETLDFTPDAKALVVSETGGNMIVNIRESRIAIRAVQLLDATYSIEATSASVSLPAFGCSRNERRRLRAPRNSTFSKLNWSGREMAAKIMVCL